MFKKAYEKAETIAEVYEDQSFSNIDSKPP